MRASARRGLVLASAAALFSAALAATRAAVEEAYREVRRDDGLQFEFVTPERPEPPGWLLRIGEAVLRYLEAIAPFLNVLFWLLVGGVAALFLYLVAREIRLRTKRAMEPPLEEAYRPTPAFARALLEEADRLAAEGRYAEAAHVLLFRSIDDIDERRPNRIKRAMTSREIGVLEILSPGARAAFSTIAGTVERAAFAGRAVDASDFRDCRASYGAFAAVEAWA